MSNRDDRELVIIGKPDDSGVPCVKGCGRVCELTPAEWHVIALGGAVLCQPCAVGLFAKYPEAFERAD